MIILKENPGNIFDAANIQRFEPKLTNNAVDEIAVDDEINQIGDILIDLGSNGRKLHELKSYKKSTLNRIPTDAGFIAQFKAYLQNNDVTSMDNLEYVFDQRKLLKEYFENLPSYAAHAGDYFDSAELAEEYIKNRFKTLFQSDGTIFNTIYSNISLRNDLGLDPSIQTANIQFDGMVSSLDERLFSFIVVK